MAGVASERRHQEPPLFQTEPVPVGSKLDPLLPKAEPISEAGDTSVTINLRKSKNHCAGAVRERNRKNVRERTLQTTRSVKKELGGGSPSAKAEIPLQPVKKTMVTQVVSLQPMEDHAAADIHSQPVEDPSLEQVDVP